MKYKKSLGLTSFILAGIAWPAGFALGFKVPQILPFHLFFVFSGLALRGSHLFTLLKQRLKSRPAS